MSPPFDLFIPFAFVSPEETLCEKFEYTKQQKQLYIDIFHFQFFSYITLFMHVHT